MVYWTRKMQFCRLCWQFSCRSLKQSLPTSKKEKNILFSQISVTSKCFSSGHVEGSFDIHDRMSRQMSEIFLLKNRKCWNFFKQFYAKMFFWIRGMQFWWSFRILFCQKPENQQLKVRNWCKKNSSFEENLVLSKISSFTGRRQLFIPGKKFSLKVRKVFARSPRKKKLIYTSEIKFLQGNFWTRRFEFWQSSLKCSIVNPIIFAWSPWMKFVKTDF